MSMQKYLKTLWDFKKNVDEAILKMILFSILIGKEQNNYQNLKI